MSMYKYTRQEASEMLGISTRSVDRYIKSGKLRSKKDGKIVYVKGSDVEALM
ncbi:MAG: helix-turn-helix domain-containing protein [Patescibacteria group bacterium]